VEREDLVWFDASTILREIVSQMRQQGATFALLHHGSSRYGFHLHEIDNLAEEDLDLQAFQALRLDPSKAISRSGGLESLEWGCPDPLSCKPPPAGANDHPIHVEDPAAAEGTTILRYPSIEVVEAAAPSVDVTLAIDLMRTADPTGAADPVELSGLPSDWTQLPVTVRVSSPQLSFASGDEEGTIRVRRDQASVRCRLIGRRIAPGPIEVTATFFHEDRWCGTARRTFAPGPAAAAAAAAVAIPPGARAPDLTVHLHRTEADPRRLIWMLAPAAEHRALVRRGCAETMLSDEPAPYVRALFQAAARSRPGAHVAALQGIGERLWGAAPPAFHEAYWAMRAALGDGFSIQLITDEPHIPWELMRPVKEGEETRLLAETHPVARGLLAYPDRLRPMLPAEGEILTLAPSYARRTAPVLPELPAAGEESAMLQQRFQAVPVSPLARRLIEVLADRRRTPVRILHFAGHGRSAASAEDSIVACEDDDVSVSQVRRQETRLGERYGTFVILNACDTGAAGSVLGDVGGWGEAFAYRRFGGFIAPLWAVFDDHAKLAIEALLEGLLVRKQPVGEALRDVRARFGEHSPTFLSYVYYGDVNARFA